jgi:hypothetical protein
MDFCQKPPCPRQSDVVTSRFEDLDRLLGGPK